MGTIATPSVRAGTAYPSSQCRRSSHRAAANSRYPHPLSQGDCCGRILQLGLGSGGALTSPDLQGPLAPKSLADRDFFIAAALHVTGSYPEEDRIRGRTTGSCSTRLSFGVRCLKPQNQLLRPARTGETDNRKTPKDVARDPDGDAAPYLRFISR